MDPISLIGIIAALLTTGSFIPQAWKTIQSQSTSDLSLATFSMIFLGTILWFVYGYFIEDLPLMVANLITACLAGIILSMKIRAMWKGEARN